MLNNTNAEDIVRNLIELLPLFQSKLIKPALKILRCSISPQQFHVIMVINEKKSINMTDLANEMMISKPQLTPIINKLIQKNYLVRKNSPEDRRVINISLTQLGKDMLKQRKDYLFRMTTQRISALQTAELAELNKAIITISQLINKLS